MWRQKDSQPRKGSNPTIERESDIKILCGESGETLKRGHEGQLPSIGEDDKTLYGNGSVTTNRDTDSPSTPLRDQQNCVHTPRFGGPTTFTLKEGLRTLGRDNIDCVPTFNPNR